VELGCCGLDSVTGAQSDVLGDLLSAFSLPPSSDQIRVLKDPCDCSSRPWSLFIAFYVTLILAAAGLPFILGRVINISTRLGHQLRTYTETTIWGDLSESDIEAAFAQTYTYIASLPLFLVSTWITLPRRAQDLLDTWPLTVSDQSSLPPAVRLKYNGDDVYFAELTQSQLKPDGRGLGTFLWDEPFSDVEEPTTLPMEGMSEGSSLKYVYRE